MLLLPLHHPIKMTKFMTSTANINLPSLCSSQIKILSLKHAVNKVKASIFYLRLIIPVNEYDHVTTFSPFYGMST